jgi:hypothetical protein
MVQGVRISSTAICARLVRDTSLRRIVKRQSYLGLACNLGLHGSSHPSIRLELIPALHRHERHFVETIGEGGESG